KSFALSDNYPNPFNPETKIRFQLPASNRVVLDIISIDGRHIKTIYNQDLDAGTYIVSWNGTDDTGRNVSSGVYIYRLQTNRFQQAKKMMLIR
ncbi:MAG: T9SS type A sorting domain-containing protein, partial [Methylococcales bacterium]|nr:T9SS type A sorting domain-containing protein [Methylococcales bacterium]